MKALSQLATAVIMVALGALAAWLLLLELGVIQ